LCNNDVGSQVEETDYDNTLTIKLTPFQSYYLSPLSCSPSRFLLPRRFLFLLCPFYIIPFILNLISILPPSLTIFHLPPFPPHSLLPLLLRLVPLTPLPLLLPLRPVPRPSQPCKVSIHPWSVTHP
jgi:hypothetical protein